MPLALLVSLLPSFLVAQTPVIDVDHDNVEINSSCTVRFADHPIIDTDGDGVVHITGTSITIDFGGSLLRGAPALQSPDTLTGIGVRVAGTNVVIRNLKASGFKVALQAADTHGLLIDQCEFAGNFRQRLKSTPKAEDASDWLWPHANDNHEWTTSYGAAVCISSSTDVTIRGVRVRSGQNGIILDRVVNSVICDNDCSFLSGWGLAMWRSSKNLISRNAFDFCVRGYSHGVYNRGQDSAGILMFEQCSDNIIAENSATHGGDGFFGFAGKEALGEANPRDEVDWYKKRGNNGNRILDNDFSFAAAHGIEMTFSFDNRFIGNQLIGNAICGLWGGYSQDSIIQRNVIEHNGEMAYGQERGGINIEHGRNNRITENAFDGNPCGVFLWWDDDPAITKLPWAKANSTGSEGNSIVANSFRGDAVAVQLRKTGDTCVAHNMFTNVPVELDADAPDAPDAPGAPGAIVKEEREVTTLVDDRPADKPLGETRPVGARKNLRGRDKIIMTEWGPYDWQAPYLQLADATLHRHIYRLLGEDTRVDRQEIHFSGAIKPAIEEDRLVVTPTARESVTPYEITMTVAGEKLVRRGVLIDSPWTVTVFASDADPRRDLDEWREAARLGYQFIAAAVDFHYGSEGPSQLNLDPAVTAAKLPADHFGTIARATLNFPTGRWRIRTTSDDGVRVWLNNSPAIDNWTHHGPTQDTHEFSLDEATSIEIRVEHFELDGYAVLSLEIEQVE